MNIFDNFDANQYQDISFGPIPDGEYRAILDSLEEKETKSANGKYLAAAFQIVDGEFQGRKLFENFNIINPSDKAQDIGRRQFASFCRAVGVLKPKRPDDLTSIPFIAIIGTKKEEGYEPKNHIKAYSPAKAGGKIEPAKTAETPATQNTPPWKRK